MTRKVRLTDDRQEKLPVWHISYALSGQFTRVWISVQPNGETERLTRLFGEAPPKPYMLNGVLHE